MTELSFLLELFLDPELPCNMRDKLVARIREVEAKLTAAPMMQAAMAQMLPSPPVLQQAPSTLAALARHEGMRNMPGNTAPLPPPPPVVLSAAELQARENSKEILSRRKHQNLKM